VLVKFEVLIIVHEQAFVQAFVLLIAYCLNFLQAFVFLNALISTLYRENDILVKYSTRLVFSLSTLVPHVQLE